MNEVEITVQPGLSTRKLVSARGMKTTSASVHRAISLRANNLVINEYILNPVEQQKFVPELESQPSKPKHQHPAAASPLTPPPTQL